METTAAFIKNCKRRAGFVTLLILIAIVPAWARVDITAAQVDVLASIIGSGDTCLTISANVSRAGTSGVIMENPDEVVTVNYPTVCLDANVPVIEDEDEECLKTSDPGYTTWVACGKPDCWCYCHQCHGDCDGCQAFGRYVALSDLECLKRCFGKTIAELVNIPDGCCGDFDHMSAFGRPCSLSDLNIFKANFGVLVLPECCPHIREYKEGCN